MASYYQITRTVEPNMVIQQDKNRQEKISIQSDFEFNIGYHATVSIPTLGANVFTLIQSEKMFLRMIGIRKRLRLEVYNGVNTFNIAYHEYSGMTPAIRDTLLIGFSDNNNTITNANDFYNNNFYTIPLANTGTLLFNSEHIMNEYGLYFKKIPVYLHIYLGMTVFDSGDVTDIQAAANFDMNINTRTGWFITKFRFAYDFHIEGLFE